MKVLPFFDLTLAYNTGAAFSFLNSASGWQNVFFSVLAFVVSIAIIAWLFRLRKKDGWLSIALCLILGGALGNAWDRLLYHYVIDFLSFHLGSWHFAIFNIADAGISVGAFMLLVQWVRDDKPQLAVIQRANLLAFQADIAHIARHNG
jgi:signal peptidase II